MPIWNPIKAIQNTIDKIVDQKGTKEQQKMEIKAMQVAQGQDPNKSIWDGINTFHTSSNNSFGGFLGGLFGKGGAGNNNPSQYAMPLAIGLGIMLFVYMIMNKRKKKK